MPTVVALAHALGRVVVLPEGLEQLLVRDLRRVVGDQHDLGVAGPAGADLLVGRVRGVAAGIADGRRHDAGELPEVLLVAPEAAETEDRGLGALGPRAGERACRGPCGCPGFMIGSGRPGRASAGEGMDSGLEVKNLMPELYARLDDESVTISSGGSPGCRRARPRAGCPRRRRRRRSGAGSSARRTHRARPSRSATRRRRRPAVPATVNTTTCVPSAALDDRAQACRPRSTCALWAKT